MTVHDTPGTAGYVGMSAPAAYTRLLLGHARVRDIAVHRYASPPSLQQRLHPTPAEQALVEHALALRASANVPFWDALLAACLQRQAHTPALIEAAFFHNGPGDASTYGRASLEGGILEELAQSGASNVGLSSQVHDAAGRTWHLALLDFRCDVSPHNEALAALVCSHVMPGGYLLIDSGDSYHACGFELLTSEERVRMLGRALLATPVVDAQYVAHQLQQDASSIRISRGGKASRQPRVVRAWDPATVTSRA